MPNQYTESEPYHDAETLEQLYHDEGKTVHEIADRFGVAQPTISRWLDLNGIETRTPSETRELRGTHYDHWAGGLHRDLEWLREKYIEEGLMAREIAEMVDVSPAAIYRSLEKAGIERRTAGDYLRKPDRIKTARHDSHEQISFCVDGSTRYYDVHRLLAIAIWGLDEVAGKVVHHKNGIPWDNRPSNLELIESQAEHARRHYEEREIDENGNFV